jgi:hypothetical protein
MSSKSCNVKKKDSICVITFLASIWTNRVRAIVEIEATDTIPAIVVNRVSCILDLNWVGVLLINVCCLMLVKVYELLFERINRSGSKKVTTVVS